MRYLCVIWPNVVMLCFSSVVHVDVVAIDVNNSYQRVHHSICHKYHEYL